MLKCSAMARSCVVALRTYGTAHERVSCVSRLVMIPYKGGGLEIRLKFGPMQSLIRGACLHTTYSRLPRDYG